MKIYFYLLVIIIAIITSFFTSCSYDNSVEPQEKGEKKTWILVPDNQTLSSEIGLLTEKSINGETGGTIEISHSIGKVQIVGNLYIPENAFSGNLNFKIEIDRQYTFQDFYPSPYTFQQPLKLDLVYLNIDLKGIDPSKIDFYYMKDAQNFIKVNYDYIKIDVEKGILAVVGAELPHFSRFGWAK
ncbi:MAG: hypothetical protein ACM3O3_11495 [Syntrophothermus sp.]